MRTDRLDLELKPGTSGYFHFGHQAQTTIGLKRFHSPEIQSIPHRQSLGIATPPPHSDAPHQKIQKTAHPPQNTRKVPTVCSSKLRMGAKAAAGEAETLSVRESTSRVPKRTPPQDRVFPPDDSASDHRVSANSRSSLCRALSIASLNPMGLTSNTFSADGFRTNVGLRRLSMSLRPMRA